MILKGSYRTVALVYETHYDEVIRIFCANGWGIKNIINPDYSKGNIYMYMVFEAGSEAVEIKLDLPNAHII